MAKGSGRKRSKKPAGAAIASRERARRLEKALAAGLRREAKAASRLEAAQIEVAVLRTALAEVVGEVTAQAAPAAVTEVEAAPAPARSRAARAPAAPKAAARRGSARRTPPRRRGRWAAAAARARSP